MNRHPSKDLLEQYSLGKGSEKQRSEVEEHLLLCEECQKRVAELDIFHAAISSALKVATSFPLRRPAEVVHYTSEGPIYSWSKRLKKGKWLAVHEGRNLEGGRICRTLREANEYLLRSFVEMFPEHRCGAKCGRAPGPASPGLGGGAGSRGGEGERGRGGERGGRRGGGDCEGARGMEGARGRRIGRAWWVWGRLVLDRGWIRRDHEGGGEGGFSPDQAGLAGWIAAVSWFGDALRRLGA